MNRDDPSEAPDPAADAAAWVIRLERGLTPEEQDRLSDWLAAGPRHRLALARMRAAGEPRHPALGDDRLPVPVADGERLRAKPVSR
jgi:ferric-dicitrate binding protein FerR (iron transport regulator)